MGSIGDILRRIPGTITEGMRKVFTTLFMIFILLAMYTLFSCGDLMSCLPRVSEYLVLAIIFGVLGFTGKRKRTRRAAAGCDKARSELEWAEKVVNALNELIPSELGISSTREYQAALHSRLSAGTGMDTHVPMAVNSLRCCIEPGGLPGDDPRYAEDWARYTEFGSDTARFEEYIRDRHFGDDPEIVWEATRAHEQVHIDRCISEIRSSDGNGYERYLRVPENYRQNDLEAYKVQIKKLREWIDAHCK